MATMHTLHSVLLATDLSPACEGAVKAASLLGTVFGSHLTLLHVLEPPGDWPGALQELREQAAMRLGALEHLLAAQDVEVTEWSVAVGSPAEAILRRAAEIDADLVLVGAGARSSPEHRAPGPVATAVLEHAPQAVLAVGTDGPGLGFRKVLCPVDHSAASLRGLGNAVRLARAFESQLVVLSVVPRTSRLFAALEVGEFGSVQAEHERLWRGAFDQFLSQIDFAGVTWQKEVRTGQPHLEIAAAAREHGADLLVLGSTGRAGWLRALLGSVTRRVLQQLPCSVLVVKREDAVEDLLEEDIRQVDLLLSEGQAFLESGAFPNALVKFRQVLAINPFHVAGLEGRALAHQGLGERGEAERYRRRAELLLRSSGARRLIPAREVPA
jgi:nucleotide-binding universal stress UspA family protein